MRINARTGCLGWAWLVLALAAGCAQTAVLTGSPAESITRRREQRTDEAVRQFEQKQDFAEFQAALARWNQHDVKACEERLQRLLKRSPNHRDARLLMAEVHLAANRPRQALAEVEQALQAHPNNARVQYTMGLVLDAMGQQERALAYYQRAMHGEPENELYAVSYHTALAAAVKNQTADRGNGERIAAVPDPTADLSSLQLLAHDAPPGGTPGNNPVVGADSVELAERAPVADLLRRGRGALVEGAPQAALAYFREASSLRPHNPQILVSAAIESLRHNQPDLAIDLLEPVGQQFRDSAAVYRVLGAAHYRRGDYKSSQVALRQALSLDKSSALSYFLMGCTLAKRGQLGSAEAHLRQARIRDPGYSLRR